MVTIRLTRRGRKNAPFYGVVVANAKSKRDGKFIEKLGHYNPISKVVVLSVGRLELWKMRGAVLSDAVRRITKLEAKQQQRKII